MGQDRFNDLALLGIEKTSHELDCGRVLDDFTSSKTRKKTLIRSKTSGINVPDTILDPATFLLKCIA